MSERTPSVWMYARVSTQYQADHGLSPEAQEEMMLRYAKFRFADGIDNQTGKPVTLRQPAAVDPAVSASTPFIQRPAGRKLWELLEPGDYLMVATFDRLFRSVADFVDVIRMMKERQIRLVLLDLHVDAGTATGELILGVMAAVSQFHSRQTSEKTKATLAYKRKNNLPYCYSSPIGYKKVGVRRESYFVPNVPERNLCRLLLELSEQRGYSLEVIANYCWKEKLLYRGSNEWTRSKVARILVAAKNNFPLPGGGRMDDSGLLHPEETNGPQDATDSPD